MDIEFIIRRVPKSSGKLETLRVHSTTKENYQLPREREKLILRHLGKDIHSTVSEVVHFYNNGDTKAVIFSDYFEVTS